MVNNRILVFRTGDSDDEVTVRVAKATVWRNTCKFLGA